MVKIIFCTLHVLLAVKPLYDMSPDNTKPPSVQGCLWARCANGKRVIT